MVTYDTLIDSSQEIVYNIISDNSTVSAFNPSIVDGMPFMQMMRETGFPYIKIPCPEPSETVYTFDKAKVIVDFSITIYTTKASLLRELTDAVRKALREGQITSMVAELKNKNLPVSNCRESVLNEQKGTIAYENTITAIYEFRGVDRA
jgi:hypothetical protein